MKHRIIRLLPAVAALALALPAQAQQKAIELTVANTTAQADAARGARRPTAEARPGDVLHYRLLFTNTTPAAVQGIKIANPLPAGVRFVAGSARATRDDARVEYSADGGRTFSAQPMEEATVDGRTVQRPVPAERYTHVRWTVEGRVAPGATVTAEFDARVQDAERKPTPATPGGR
ncbi:MAG TPA: hypothetical protein VFQ45_09945 [Longimicrobium sp.]|nr:hypothetical protein [Longimicrobium sp.]